MAKKEEKRDGLEQQAYETGLRARRNAIARNQAPHGKDDKLLEHWEAGWDFEDDLRGTAGAQDNAVANDPNADQSGDNAVGQAGTVSGAKKK